MESRATSRRHFWIIGCGIAVEIIQALFLVQAFGFYAVEWMREFDWSSTAIGGAFSIYRGGTGLVAPFQGMLLGRVGARKLMFVGTLVLGIGYAALGQANGLLSIYAVFAILAIGSSLCGPLTIMAVIVDWFQRRQASALAATQLGYGISGLLVPLMALSMTQFGWRATALYSGIAILAIGLPICFILRDKPEQVGLRPYGAPSQPDEAMVPDQHEALVPAGEQPTTVSEALRLPAFWLLSFGHGAAVIFISAVTVHLVPFLNGELGLDASAAAWVVLLLSLAIIAGQLMLTVGEISISKKIVIVVALLVHAAALVILARANGFSAVVIFVVLYGMAWGIRGPVTHAQRAEYFGRALFGRISGIAFLISMCGMVIGPLFGGLLADLFSSSRPSFLVLAGVALISAVLFTVAKRPNVRR